MTFARNIALVALVVIFSAPASAVVTDTDIWINEFHYDDNVAGDAGEFVEVIAPAGFADLSTVQIDFYNGANGEVYETHTLDSFTQGDTTDGFTFYSLPNSALGQIQNSVDGLALSVGGATQQFLSYEGSFAAVDGPASGQNSTNINVNETNSSTINSSLELQGTGDSLGDYQNNWVVVSQNTTGALNANQDLRGKLLNESFDDASQFTTSAAFFSDNGSDYFGLTDNAGNSDYGAGPIPTEPNYTGNTGSYLNGQDLDGEGAGLPIVLDWTGIDISNYENLEFMGSFAEFFDSPGDIDQADDSILVEVQIDGGGFVSLLAFEGSDFTSGSSPNQFNGIFREDTDFDGEGDGVALGNEFAQFIKNISGTGATLDLRLSVFVNSGDEDFAADSFMIVGDLIQGGTDVPEPTTLALLGFGGLAIARRRRVAV